VGLECHAQAASFRDASGVEAETELTGDRERLFVGMDDPEQKISRPRQLYVGEQLRHLESSVDSG
jgi:hypothetical protein